MTFDVFKSKKLNTRLYISISIFLIGIISIVLGFVFDILFLKILFIICMFVLWVPSFFSKNEFEGTISFNETGIVISLQNTEKVYLSFADIRHISTKYGGYEFEMDFVGTKPVFRSGVNSVKIQTDDKEYRIDFLIKSSYSKANFEDYATTLEENDVSHSIES